MSRKSRVRQQAAFSKRNVGKSSSANYAPAKMAGVACLSFIAGAAVVYGLVISTHVLSVSSNVASATQSQARMPVISPIGLASTLKASESRLPLTYDDLVKLPEDQLAQVDIARMNLLCATGLPGGENLDIEAPLKKMDEWALYCKGQIDANLHRYYDDPGMFRDMEGYYRMAMLVTVIKQDLRIHYDNRHPNDEPYKTFFRRFKPPFYSRAIERQSQRHLFLYPCTCNRTW